LPLAAAAAAASTYLSVAREAAGQRAAGLPHAAFDVDRAEQAFRAYTAIAV